MADRLAVDSELERAGDDERGEAKGKAFRSVTVDDDKRGHDNEHIFFFFFLLPFNTDMTFTIGGRTIYFVTGNA